MYPITQWKILSSVHLSDLAGFALQLAGFMGIFHGCVCLFVLRVWTKTLWIISCLFRTLGKVLTWPTSSGLPRLTQKHKSSSRPLVLVYISLILCKLTAMPNGNTLLFALWRNILWKFKRGTIISKRKECDLNLESK